MSYYKKFNTQMFKSIILVLLCAIYSYIPQVVHSSNDSLTQEQANMITKSIKIEGDLDQSLYDVVLLSDGNYMACGEVKRWGLYGIERNGWVVKFNSSGNILNKFEYLNTYGNLSRFNKLLVRNDGKILLFGSTNGVITKGEDGLMVCIDIDGNMLWHRSYGDVGDDRINNAILFDNKIITVGSHGRIQTPLEGVIEKSKPWILVMDNNGNALESRQVSENYGICTGIALSNDGGILLSGQEVTCAGSNGFLASFNKDLNMKWVKRYTIGDNNRANQIIRTHSGDYYLLGWTSNNNDENGVIWVVDSYGNTKEFHQLTNTNYVSELLEINNTYVLFCSAKDPTFKYQSEIKIMDSQWNEIESHKYDLDSQNSLDSFIKTPDGGYILCGDATKFLDIYRDAWIIWLDASFNQIIN